VTVKYEILKAQAQARLNMMRHNYAAGWIYWDMNIEITCKCCL